MPPGQSFERNVKPKGSLMVARRLELIVTAPRLCESEGPDLLTLRRDRLLSLRDLRQTSGING